MSITLRALPALACLSLSLFTVGCGVSNLSNSSAPVAHTIVLNGRVHGGQQPVVGSTIQLYAASETAFQGASTPLLAVPVLTDLQGNFSITGDYTCPSSNPLVYVVATGGNPGLPGNQTNPGIAEMSALGSCNDLGANTFIFINELTTVVAVEALAPFMTDYAHIGSAPSSISGVAFAFGEVSPYIDLSTGQFPFGFPYLVLHAFNFNTVADIIAACVNSAGGSSSCNTLYSNTGGATDTIGAAIAIVTAPGQNASQLYSLISSNAPYQPSFTSAPSDLTATVGYTLPQFVQAATLDSNGRLWFYFGGYNYDTGSDSSTASPGYIQVYDNNFNPLFTVNPGTGGLYYPVNLASDASGHVFAINVNNSVSEFDSNGNAVSPSTGWASGLPAAFNPVQSGNFPPYNSFQADPIGVDAQGNIWGDNTGGSGANNCYFEMNSSGTATTPNGDFCGNSGEYSGPDVFALDGSGSAWAVGGAAIGKVNSQGNLAALAPVQQGCFYGDSGNTSQFSQQGEIVTQGLDYDHLHNQLWAYSAVGIGAITDAGASVFCDFGSTTLPVAQQNSTGSASPGTPFSGASILINDAVLDGGGNYWFVTSRTTESGVVGSSTDTFTGTAAFSSYLGELSPTGVLQTPYDPANGVYGLQPDGFGPRVGSTTTSNVSVYSAVSGVRLLGVDSLGNIWAYDTESNKLLRISGLAVPNTVNYGHITFLFCLLTDTPKPWRQLCSSAAAESLPEARTHPAS